MADMEGRGGHTSAGGKAPPSAHSCCHRNLQDTRRRSHRCPPSRRWRHDGTAASPSTLTGLKQHTANAPSQSRLYLLVFTFCTFVTETPPPARLTVALPGLLTGAVATAGHRDAALALLAVPPRVTPVNAHRSCDHGCLSAPT